VAYETIKTQAQLETVKTAPASMVPTPGDGLVLFADSENGGQLTAKLPDGSNFVLSGASSGGDTNVLNWPVSYPVTGTFWQTTQPVSGTFWQATQPVSGTFWQSVQPVSGPLTDTQLRALAVPVSGTVSVGNFPATQAVTGAFYPATQPVSGTFWQTTQPVSGTFWQATQPVSIALPVAVTGTFWQATQPVSGPLTDTQLRAVAVPVSGTFFQATQPISAATLPLPTGAAKDLPSTLCVTGTAAAGSGVTITLPAVVGQFHYISSIRISAYNTAARTGGALPVSPSTTNLPGSLAFTFGSAGAVGTVETQQVELGGNPMKSSVANTATTIACPSTTSVIWRVTAFYQAAP